MHPLLIKWQAVAKNVPNMNQAKEDEDESHLLILTYISFTSYRHLKFCRTPGSWR